ncbi:GUN4 domain-containing protein [Microcoleus sp. A003_D6]|uniref:GUN4 domain-containing protein n=1 Tax=Microcoleus sp. A003_D6 TaxID=3055266 RepID=UPI002FD18CA5
MKILILASNPRKDLNLDREIRDLRGVIEKSRNREEFEVVDELAVRVGDLQELLFRHQPQIVHFCGHGSGEQGLVFESDMGREHLVSTDALSNLFRLFSNSIECVLLNACYSEEQAGAIVDHINYVIGMNQEIRDDAAIAFSKGFYRALGYACSIEQSYEFGCNAIQLEISGSSVVRSAVSETKRKLGVADAVAKIAIPEHQKPILKKKPTLTPNLRASNTSPNQTLSQEKRIEIQLDIDKSLEADSNIKIQLQRETSPKKEVASKFKGFFLLPNGSWIGWLAGVLCLLGITGIAVKLTSELINPNPNPLRPIPVENSNPLRQIPLESDAEINYQSLQISLSAKDWKSADSQTMSSLLEIANKKRPARSSEQTWLDPKDIRELPCNDLKTINQLWSVASKNRWGFMTQSIIWQRVGGTTKTEPDNSGVRKNFSIAVGWHKADVGKFDLEALYVNLNNQPPEKHSEGYLPSAIGQYKDRQIWVGQFNEFAVLTARLKQCKIFPQ